MHSKAAPKALLLLGLLFTQLIHTKTLMQICVTALNFGQGIVYPKNDSSSFINMTLWVDGELYTFREVLGRGKPSEVHVLESHSVNSEPLVAKVARAEKYEENIQTESRLYAKHYPELRGRVIPLRSTAQHMGKTVITKTRVKAKSLNKLLEEGKLSEAQKKSLKETLSWAQDIEKKHKIQLDLNTFNFAWVDNPQDLARLGLETPRFMLFEFTPTSSSMDRRLYNWILREALQ
jgi:hypothetical protein